MELERRLVLESLEFIDKCYFYGLTSYAASESLSSERLPILNSLILRTGENFYSSFKNYNFLVNKYQKELDRIETSSTPKLRKTRISNLRNDVKTDIGLYKLNYREASLYYKMISTKNQIFRENILKKEALLDFHNFKLESLICYTLRESSVKATYIRDLEDNQLYEITYSVDGVKHINPVSRINNYDFNDIININGERITWKMYYIDTKNF